jgi:hypothetical protein
MRSGDPIRESGVVVRRADPPNPAGQNPRRPPSPFTCGLLHPACCWYTGMNVEAPTAAPVVPERPNGKARVAGRKV